MVFCGDHGFIYFNMFGANKNDLFFLMEREKTAGRELFMSLSLPKYVPIAPHSVIW